MRDLIVNLTPTGMVPTKAMTPFVPIHPGEILDEILFCYEIGITMVHLHARAPDGSPSYSRDIYGSIIEAIRRRAPDLVICVSLSGRNFQEFEKRSEPLDLVGLAKPDMGSLTLSSMNFVQQASVNAPEIIQSLAAAMLARGIVPELEIFDLGMVNYAKYLFRKGFLRAPHYANLFLGNVAGAQLDATHLGAMVSGLPDQTLWSVAGIGDAQLQANLLGIALGDGVRVGLEDSIHMDVCRQKLATNEDLVRRIRSIAELAGRSIMTSEELRARLQLKGRI